MQQENMNTSGQSQLSEIWQELLGSRLGEQAQTSSSEATIPVLASDPWSALLHAKGVEMVDLHEVHLHMSDQDVEQALQIMQEQPDDDTYDHS